MQMHLRETEMDVKREMSERGEKKELRFAHKNLVTIQFCDTNQFVSNI